MIDECLWLFVVAQQNFVGIILHVCMTISGKISHAREVANLELICILNHVILYALFHILLIKYFLDMIVVILMILVSTFPSDYSEVSSIILIELHNEFELEIWLTWLNLRVGDLSIPDMSLAPSHSHATHATVSVRIPAPHRGSWPEHPQLLAKACLISNTQSNWGEIGLKLWLWGISRDRLLLAHLVVCSPSLLQGLLLLLKAKDIVNDLISWIYCLLVLLDQSSLFSLLVFFGYQADCFLVNSKVALFHLRHLV